MIGGELKNAVAEADLLRALAGRGEKGFRRGRVRIFLEKMMLHHPGMVIAEPVGGLELGQRVLVEPELVALFPGARQLQLVKDTEFHDAPPKDPLVVFRQCIRHASQVQPRLRNSNSVARKQPCMERANGYVYA